jgi:hypothetical protein
MPWRTSRTCVRSGANPAFGRAVVIARSFEKRTCDCWQLVAANAVTAIRPATASTARQENRARGRVRFSANPSRPSAEIRYPSS